MGYLLDEVKRVMGREEDENAIGCRAIVSDGGDEVCGVDPWGRGCVDGHEVKYCEDHAPSDAASAAMGASVLRTEDIEFYVPEDDTVVEVR